MNLHAEPVDCPCQWCQLHGQNVTGHRVMRYYFDEVKPSAAAIAMMDEVIRDAVRAASRLERARGYGSQRAIGACKEHDWSDDVPPCDGRVCGVSDQAPGDCGH